MLELRCTHTTGTNECGRFLARLEGGILVLYCSRCKEEQRIPLASLVTHYADEARELERKISGDEGNKLLW